MAILSEWVIPLSQPIWLMETGLMRALPVTVTGKLQNYCAALTIRFEIPAVPPTVAAGIPFIMRLD